MSAEVCCFQPALQFSAVETRSSLRLSGLFQAYVNSGEQSVNFPVHCKLRLIIFPFTRENLSVCGSRWWLRCVLLNILLFLLLFFLTTPAIIVNTMDKFNVTRPVESLRVRVSEQFY